MRKNKILIHGIGNEILTDDGIGPKLVKRIESDFSGNGIDFETAFVGGLEVLEYIQGYKKVIFIDAIRTENGVPGSVYKLLPEHFNSTIHLSSVHDVSFLTALGLGKELGMDMPKDVYIIAVEIVEDRIFDENFTPEIQEKYEGIYSKTRKLIDEMLAV